MPDKIPNTILDMLRTADTDAAVFPPTILYNEGWMLRLILSAGKEGVPCLPFSFLPGSRWFSEALLHSPFLARYHGDELAETHTHADGVVGRFEFSPKTKTGLEIDNDSKQFIVIEAKMYSSLSRGIKKAPFYDQAARTVACMAATVGRDGKPVDEIESIGFYVVAPAEQINRGVFAEQMKPESIVEKVKQRVEAYRKDSEEFSKLQTWFLEVFEPMVRRIDLDCWPWETAVNAIVAAKPAEGSIVKDFYQLCKEYCGRKKESSARTIPDTSG